MKRIHPLLSVAVTAGFLLLGAQSALAATDPGCTTLGGADGTGTCVVPAGNHNVTGVINVGEPLFLQTNAILTVTGTSLTLNVTVGSMEMDKGSAILGGGRNITVNVPTGDMTMDGTAGALGDKCGYPSLPNPALGARITSIPATLATTITINVGNYPNNVTPTGSFFMERCSLVDASNHFAGGSSGSAGTVVITAGREADLDGQVLSESLLSGTGGAQAPGGGPITVQSGCKLTVSSTGVVSSKGADPGADLVHLEGCDVFIDGLVQSTGPGHVVPINPPNHCATGVHSAKPAISTACVEIIGQNITISNTGEVNANVNSTGSGGPQGSSWIDLYAYDDFFLTGRTAAAASFLVHANSLSGTDVTPNTITVVAQNGGLTGSGKLFQASDTANGSNGGTVNITTMLAINLVGNTPTILAQGHNGAPSATNGCSAGGAGNCGKGGFINLQSWSDKINWLAGSGNVNPDVAGGTHTGFGVITLLACTGIDTTGTSFGNATLGLNLIENPATCPAGTPPVPAYIQAAFDVGDPIWDACAPFHASKSGKKFNDLDNSGSFTAGDTPIAGWPINLLTTGNVLISTVNTAADGTYTFTFNAPGTFRVCEGVGPAGFTQTFPHAGNVHVGETVINTCPAPNIWGYEFTIVNGSEFIDDDFGNNKPSHKSGHKFNDVDNSATITVPPDTPIVGWPIKLYKLPDLTTAVQTVNTGAGGAYSFTIKVAGNYQVCEGVGPAGFVQTFPNLGVVVSPPEAVVNTCPAPNIWGYTFPIVSGDEFTDDDFANFKPGGGQECKKQTVIDIMNATYPNNLGPDTTVHTNLNESVQAAVDAAADTNGDGYIIVMVIAHADGSLGGSSNQKVVVSKDYGTAQPFGLFGCSVTLTGGGSDPAIWIKDSASSKLISVNGRTTKIFVADLHGGNSAIGLQADGDNKYIRNEGPSGNGTGIKVLGNNNTVHNGSVSASSGVGLQITGNGNYVTDTAIYTSTSHGVQVTGNTNQLLKMNIGDIGKGNGGDGLNVAGNGNTLQENTSRSNTLVGIHIPSGTGNTLKKNVSGGTASQNNGGCEYDVAAGNVNNGENKANNVTVPGAVGSPFPTGCI